MLFQLFLFLSVNWLETLLHLWNLSFQLNMSKVKPIPPPHKSLLIPHFLLLLKTCHSSLHLGQNPWSLTPLCLLSVSPADSPFPQSGIKCSHFSLSNISCAIPSQFYCSAAMLVQVLKLFHVNYCSNLTDLFYSSLSFTFQPGKKYRIVIKYKSARNRLLEFELQSWIR